MPTINGAFIKVVVVLVRQLRHGFTKKAKVSPNLTVAHYIINKQFVFIPQAKNTK